MAEVRKSSGPLPQASNSSLQSETEEKHPSHYQSQELSSDSHFPSSPTTPLEAKLSVRDAHLKRSIRILKLITRLIALVLAIATGTQETLTLHTYLTTHSIQRDGRGPWALETSLWPSFLLLTISFLTIILSGLVMIAYLREGVKAANKIHSFEFIFETGVEGGHVLLWIIVAVLYRVGKTGHDLWGWACSPLAEKIQPNFEGIVNFDQVCKRGSRSWELSILSAVLQGLTALTLLLTLERRKHKQRLAILREGSVT